MTWNEPGFKLNKSDYDLLTKVEASGLDWRAVLRKELRVRNKMKKSLGNIKRQSLSGKTIVDDS